MDFALGSLLAQRGFSPGTQVIPSFLRSAEVPSVEKREKERENGEIVKSGELGGRGDDGNRRASFLFPSQRLPRASNFLSPGSTRLISLSPGFVRS